MVKIHLLLFFLYNPHNSETESENMIFQISPYCDVTVGASPAHEWCWSNLLAKIPPWVPHTVRHVYILALTPINIMSAPQTWQMFLFLYRSPSKDHKSMSYYFLFDNHSVQCNKHIKVICMNIYGHTRPSISDDVGSLRQFQKAKMHFFTDLQLN